MCQILLRAWHHKKEWKSVPKSAAGLLDLAPAQFAEIHPECQTSKESVSVRSTVLVPMTVTGDFTERDYYGQRAISSLTFCDWLNQICHGKFSPLRSLKTRLHIWEKESGRGRERERERWTHSPCKSVMFFASIFRDSISRHHFQCSTGVNTYNSPNHHMAIVLLSSIYGEGTQGMEQLWFALESQSWEAIGSLNWTIFNSLFNSKRHTSPPHFSVGSVKGLAIFFLASARESARDSLCYQD